MDDILASIRRILNEEHAKAPDSTAHPAEAHQDSDDVLHLDATMMEPEEPPAPSMAEAVIPVPQPDEAPETPPAVPMPSRPLAVPFPTPTLVAPEAAASAAASVGALMRTLATERSTAVHRGGPTLEDLVREEMRPLLKEWLDTHLAPMVERLVRAEIERVVSRMT